MKFTYVELIWLIAIATLGVQVLPVAFLDIKRNWPVLTITHRLTRCMILMLLFGMWLAYVSSFINLLTHKNGV